MKLTLKRCKKRKFASELVMGAIMQEGVTVNRGDAIAAKRQCQCHAMTPRRRPIDHGVPGHREQHFPLLATCLHDNFTLHEPSFHLPSSTTCLSGTSSPSSSANVPFITSNTPNHLSTSPLTTLRSLPRCRQHRHWPGRRLWSTFLLLSILCAQVATVHAMLDALKALFILTGASTYLVTKYVNITNRTDGYPTGDGYGYFHTGGNSTPMQLQHFNLSRLNELNPALSFFKDDKGNGPSKPLNGLSAIRPVYVLAIEEEEEERSLPKVLLKLAISDPAGAQQTTTNNRVQGNISQSIEYILDAKMDDLAPVLHNFLVNKSTGELFLIRPLDRDPPKGREVWKFSVQARNRRTQFILAVADVLITVRDINDNKPLFEQKLYRTTLMENGPAGQILTKVTAVDFDDGDTTDNGKVVYSLLKSSTTHAGAASVYGARTSQSMSISDYFQIDPHSGVLTALACCFDREKRAEYSLVARATDAGGLSDEATIVVTIGDLNDCPPKFLNPSRTLVLNDDSFNSFWLDQSSSEQQEDLSSGYSTSSNPGSQSNSRGLFPLSASRPPVNSMDENIATFYVSDDDLPETNHLSFDILNSTNCSLFHRFYMVANEDTTGTLVGSRAKLSSPLEYNRTYSCQLTIAVHDSVRDTPNSGGQTYEDVASLTLIYRNNTPPIRNEQTSNAAVVAMDSAPDQRGTLPKPRIEHELITGNGFEMSNSKGAPSDASGPVSSGGPVAYDLTGKRVPHSECALCQNGGQCIVTETGYRFRCYCQAGFDGALCERALHKSDIDRMLASITANELLFYGCLIVTVNLLVIVLGLMVWIVKRVRTTTVHQPSETILPPSMLEANLDMGPSGTIQVLQQPLMMTVMEPGEFKQALELDHYVLG